MNNRSEYKEITAYLHNQTNVSIYKYCYTADYDYEEEIQAGDEFYYRCEAPDEFLEIVGKELPLITREDCISVFDGEITDNMKLILKLNNLYPEEIDYLVLKQDYFHADHTRDINWEKFFRNRFTK